MADNLTNEAPFGPESRVLPVKYMSGAKTTPILIVHMSMPIKSTQCLFLANDVTIKVNEGFEFPQDSNVQAK